jgi:hypothetical protein
VNRPKPSDDHAQKGTERRNTALELVTLSIEAVNALPGLSACEILSMAFRQRGIPCLDTFTREVVGAFRVAMGHNWDTDGHERKSMPVYRWLSADVIAALWTIDPVVSSMIMRGNSTDVASTLKSYGEELELVEPMSMTMHPTRAKSDNEL